jgi:hypothetical protein
MAKDNSIFDQMIEMGMGMTMAREMSRMTEQALHSTSQPVTQTPPPIAQPAGQLYAAINNTQAGPFTEQEFITLIQRGLVNGSTLVWKAGLPSWVPATQVPEVGKLLLLYSK